MGIQVQSATKNRQGQALSVLKRQFISFSYGGINIEDFDLLAVFVGDRLNKEIYAPFNDTTTEQAELDGQMFWRTNFKAGHLSFDLATDGITSKQLEEFKNWFQPGIARELILAEHNNRAIMARVATSPQISLLPFEKKTQVKIGNQSHETSISLYKGEIKLDFVMDDPYWYSKNSYIENLSAENVKLILEDELPHLSMFDNSNIDGCFFANNTGFLESGSPQINFKINSFPIQDKTIMLYYRGTAPEKPNISFLIKPQLNGNGKIIFSGQGDSYFLKIGPQIFGSKKHFLYFTLPSLFSQYNKAVDIINELHKDGASLLDLRSQIQTSVFNYYTRGYIMHFINSEIANPRSGNDSLSITDAIMSDLETYMSLFLDPNNPKYTCKFFNKTGEVTFSGWVRTVTGPGTFQYKRITENAGDMVKSNYLILEKNNVPFEGKITQSHCLEISSNAILYDLEINYNYRYL